MGFVLKVHLILYLSSLGADLTFDFPRPQRNEYVSPFFCSGQTHLTAERGNWGKKKEKEKEKNNVRVMWQTMPSTEPI